MVNLYVGCADKPFHQQHIDVMNRYQGDWLYIDKYVKGEGILNYDAFNLPFEDVRVIYASHLLEHISHTKVEKLLKYWHSLLVEGGKLVLNVPDLEWACKVFVEVVKDTRNNEPISGYYNTPAKFMDIFYGSHAHKGEYHKSGFTKELLEGYLSDFKTVSVTKKFEAHDMGCLIVEARK